MKENEKSDYGIGEGQSAPTFNMNWDDEDEKIICTNYAYNAAPFNSGSGDSSCYNGGSWMLTGITKETDESVLHLKVSGYTIGFVEQETKAAAAANAIENSPVLREFMALRDHYKALAPQEPVEEPSEEPVEEPAINEELVINSAVLKATKIVSGKNATLTAKVSGDAASIVVLDADGNAVEFKKVASNEKNGIVTFQAVWTVTGNRGDVLNFTVVVYDSNGLRSSNTVPVTVTIK